MALKSKYWILIFAILLAGCLALSLTFMGGDPAARAEITSGGKVLRVVDLHIDQELVIPCPTGGTNTVTVRDGKIAVTGSDCPGGDCIHSGWISASGRSIVCLPNRMEIRIVAVSGEVDFVVG